LTPSLRSLALLRKCSSLRSSHLHNKSSLKPPWCAIPSWTSSPTNVLQPPTTPTMIDNLCYCSRRSVFSYS
jgi:hypothetical protein